MTDDPPPVGTAVHFGVDSVIKNGLTSEKQSCDSQGGSAFIFKRKSLSF